MVAYAAQSQPAKPTQGGTASMLTLSGFGRHQVGLAVGDPGLLLLQSL
jgi:hypothetical protein